MSGPDRRHALAVAERALALVKPAPDSALARQVAAAALLHDVGKVEAALGTFSRVGVTLAAITFGRERLCGGAGGFVTGTVVSSGSGRQGRGFRQVRRRAVLYLTHDEVGAALLRQAGSDEFIVQWARQHHLPPERWALDTRLARALKEADGD